MNGELTEAWNFCKGQKEKVLQQEAPASNWVVYHNVIKRWERPLWAPKGQAIKWPIFFRRMATLANGRIKNWSMEIHRIFFLDDGKWQNTFLEVKKCFPLNLNVWHKYFCLLQALPHHILQCILSLITVLLKWCFFLIWITSFIFNCSGYWKLFFKLCSDEWVLSCVRPIISVWVFARILLLVRKVFTQHWVQHQVTWCDIRRFIQETT